MNSGDLGSAYTLLTSSRPKSHASDQHFSGGSVFIKSVMFRVQTAPFDKITIDFCRSRRRLHDSDLPGAKKHKIGPKFKNHIFYSVFLPTPSVSTPLVDPSSECFLRHSNASPTPRGATPTLRASPFGDKIFATFGAEDVKEGTHKWSIIISAY